MQSIFKKTPKQPLFTDFAPNETFKSSLKGIFYFLFYSKTKLENECQSLLKKYLKLKNSQIFFFFSGRSALFNLYKALNLTKGSRALYQAFTCSTAILPAIETGIKPVYVDIETSTFSINPIEIKHKINSNTKLLVLQHIYGFTPIKRPKILSIIKKANLLLIEDIAHTIKPIKFDYDKNKQFFLLSFGRSKALSSAFGGAIVLKNKRVGERLKKLQDNLRKPSLKIQTQILLYKIATPIIKSTYSWGFGKVILKLIKPLFPPEISKKEKQGQFDKKYNLKISKLQLAFLLSQLEDYERIKQKREKNLEWLLRNINKKFLPPLPPKIKDPIIRLPIFVSNPKKVIEKYKKKNIFLGRWYYQPIIGVENIEKLGYKKTSCPKAEKASKKIITIGL